MGLGPPVGWRDADVCSCTGGGAGWWPAAGGGDGAMGISILASTARSTHPDARTLKYFTTPLACSYTIGPRTVLFPQNAHVLPHVPGHRSLRGGVAHLGGASAAPPLVPLVEAGDLSTASSAAVGQLAMRRAVRGAGAPRTAQRRRAARARRAAGRGGRAVLVSLGGRRAGERRVGCGPGGRDAASDAAALVHLVRVRVRVGVRVGVRGRGRVRVRVSIAPAARRWE